MTIDLYFTGYGPDIVYAGWLVGAINNILNNADQIIFDVQPLFRPISWAGNDGFERSITVSLTMQ